MFTVRWVRSALDDLAAIWLDAESDRRAEITAATHRIDVALRMAPQEQGESRPNGRRIFFAAPLAVTFHVVDEQRLVRVLDVWTFKTRV